MKILEQKTVKELFDLKNEGQIFINTKYQREKTINPRTASLIIDSLIRGRSIGEVCLYQTDDGRYSLVDGQQRISSICDFKSNNLELKIKREDGKNGSVRSDLNNLTYQQLSSEDKDRLNSNLVSVVFYDKEEDEQDIYVTLNKGARNLNPMELRKGCYGGDFWEMGIRLAQRDDMITLYNARNRNEWRKLDLKKNTKYNVSRLIYIALAFYEFGYENYSNNTEKYITNILEKYYDADQKTIIKIEKKLSEALTFIRETFGKYAMRKIKKQHRSFFESNENIELNDLKGEYFLTSQNEALFKLLMYSFMQRSDYNLLRRNKKEIRSRFYKFQIEDVSYEYFSNKSSDKAAVQYHYRTWMNILDEILRHDTKQNRCFSKEQIQELFDENSNCPICKDEIDSIDSATGDHIMMYGDGGETIIENGRATHKICNHSRNQRENISQESP